MCKRLTKKEEMAKPSVSFTIKDSKAKILCKCIAKLIYSPKILYDFLYKVIPLKREVLVLVVKKWFNLR